MEVRMSQFGDVDSLANPGVMQMMARLFIIGVLLFPFGPAAADDPAQANRLLIQAAKLFRQANQTESMERLCLLEGVLAKLNEIVDHHPSSDLAVRLITGQPVGFLLLDDVAHTVIKEQIQAGKLESALATAELISLVSVRTDMLAQIAPLQARNRDVQGALATAHLIPTHKAGGLNKWTDRDKVLGQIAEIQAREHRDIEGAKATVQLMQPSGLKDELSGMLTNLSIEAAQEAEEARRELCIQSLDFSDPGCSSYVGDILESLLLAGNLEDALAAAEMVEGPARRDQALEGVANAQIDSRAFDNALATAERIESGQVRTRVFNGIAAEEVSIVGERLSSTLYNFNGCQCV